MNRTRLLEQIKQWTNDELKENHSLGKKMRLEDLKSRLEKLENSSIYPVNSMQRIFLEKKENRLIVDAVKMGFVSFEDEITKEAILHITGLTPEHILEK